MEISRSGVSVHQACGATKALKSTKTHLGVDVIADVILGGGGDMCINPTDRGCRFECGRKAWAKEANSPPLL
eukprot:1144964-Pelagomonas_calceolata.AAC.10